MKKYILQHAAKEQKYLLDLVQATNQKYADAHGFEYKTDSTIRCKDRAFYWEKIAYLKEFLPTVEDGSLVVWEDADSLNLGTESFETALPAGGVFGMVQIRAGMNQLKLMPWYNSGVMVMVNNPGVRAFLNRAWDLGGRGDEDGLVAALKETDWTIGGVRISPIDPKWNCWKNNDHICPVPVVKTFHGMSIDDKIAGIKKLV